MRKKEKLVFGWGTNDADYPVYTVVNGNRARCPYYRTWNRMLERALSPALHARAPTYADCTVCEEWRFFSAFRRWMAKQDWEGKQLDKDILIPGNKIYSPEACAFIDVATNTLLNDRAAARGDWPIGVYVHSQSGKYVAKCKESGRSCAIGCFDTPEEAHKAYMEFKSKVIVRAALRQPDLRVYQALRRRAIDMLTPPPL